MAVGMCEIDSQSPLCPSCACELVPPRQPAELAVGFLCAGCNLAWVVEFAVHARRSWTCFPVTIGRIDPWMPDWRPDFDYWPGARVRDGDEEFVAVRPHGSSVRPSLEAYERGWTWLRLPPNWDGIVADAHPTVVGPIGPRSRPSPLANSDRSDRSVSDADEYPDPATLPREQRRGVRLHQHEPDRLWPWVFRQHQVWVDVHGHEHEIESMPRAYVANVIAHCQKRALLIRAICADDDHPHDESPSLAIAGEELIDELLFTQDEACAWLRDDAPPARAPTPPPPPHMLSERALLRLGRRTGRLRLEISWRGGRAGECRVDQVVLELTLPPPLAPRRQRLGYLGTRWSFKRLIPNGPFIEWLTDCGVVMVALGWRGAR